MAHKRPINICNRAVVRVGWFALLAGESRAKSITRTTHRVNAEGYRVSFIVADQLSLFGLLWNLIILILTLGFYSRSQGLLIIGERVDEQAATTVDPSSGTLVKEVES